MRNRKQERRAVTGRGVRRIVIILRRKRGAKQGYALGVALFVLGLCLSRVCLGEGKKIIRRGGKEGNDELIGGVVVSEREGVREEEKSE